MNRRVFLQGLGAAAAVLAAPAPLGAVVAPAAKPRVLVSPAYIMDISRRPDCGFMYQWVARWRAADGREMYWATMTDRVDEDVRRDVHAALEAAIRAT